MSEVDSLSSILRVQKEKSNEDGITSSAKHTPGSNTSMSLRNKLMKQKSNKTSKYMIGRKGSSSASDKDPVANVSSLPTPNYKDFYNPASFNDSDDLLKIKKVSKNVNSKLNEKEMNELRKHQQLKRKRAAAASLKKNVKKQKRQKTNSVSSSDSQEDGDDDGDDSDEDGDDDDDSDSGSEGSNSGSENSDEEIKKRAKKLRRPIFSTVYDEKFETSPAIIQEKQKHLNTINNAKRAGIILSKDKYTLHDTFFDLYTEANRVDDLKCREEQIDQCEQVILTTADVISKYHQYAPLLNKLKLKGFHAGLESVSGKLREALGKIYDEDGSLPHMPAKVFLVWTIAHCAGQCHVAQSSLDKIVDEKVKQREEAIKLTNQVQEEQRAKEREMMEAQMTYPPKLAQIMQTQQQIMEAQTQTQQQQQFPSFKPFQEVIPNLPNLNSNSNSNGNAPFTTITGVPTLNPYQSVHSFSSSASPKTPKTPSASRNSGRNTKSPRRTNSQQPKRTLDLSNASITDMTDNGSVNSMDWGDTSSNFGGGGGGTEIDSVLTIEPILPVSEETLFGLQGTV